MLRGHILVVVRRRRLVGLVGSPGFAAALLELIQHADGSVLADPVAHLLRVYPHRELAGEDAVYELRGEAAALARLGDNRIHFSVDANAPVSRALERLLREPVVSVASSQRLYEGVAELLQLGLVDVPPAQPDQVDQEIRRGLKF